MSRKDRRKNRRDIFCSLQYTITGIMDSQNELNDGRINAIQLVKYLRKSYL